jgi:UDP-glucose 4-epimerase
MRNVLLIGGTGFIGSNIVKQMLRENYNVSVLELPNANKPKMNVKVHYGKLEQLDFIKRIIDEDAIDTVIHLACTLIPTSTLEAYLNEFETIIKPTIKLLPFLADSNIKFVFFSSGGTIYGVNEKGVFSESDKTNPISYYGQSKLILEESILLESRKSRLNYLIIRPSNPYGIGQNIYGKQGLIAACIGHILNGEKITIWGDGSVVRDYIHIDDLSWGVVKVIEKGVNNQIYNIGSGNGYAVKDIINILKKCVGVDFSVEYLEGRTVDVPVMILDVEKFQDIVGNTKTAIEQGIVDFYNYELINNI